MTTMTTEGNGASKPTNPNQFTVNAQLLSRMWASVSPARSTDQTRPMLCGMRVEVKSDGVQLVGCDSYILAFAWELENPPIGELVHELLFNDPAVDKFMAERAKDPVGSEVTFTVSNGRECEITNQTTTIRTRLQEGEYPKWESLFKIEGDQVARAVGMDAKKLATIAKMVSTLYKGTTRSSKLYAPVDTMVLSPGNGLKPVLWHAEANGVFLSGLLMPVRLGDTK